MNLAVCDNDIAATDCMHHRAAWRLWTASPGSLVIGRMKCPATGPGIPRMNAKARLGVLDLDLLLPFLRLGLLRQSHRQNAVLELRLDLLCIDPVGHAEGALERTVMVSGKII